MPRIIMLTNDFLPMIGGVAINIDYLASALNNLGNTCREIGDNQNAIKYYKKAISIDNDYAEANYSLGSAYQDLGQLEEAVKCYEKVLTLRPNFYELHNNIAIIPTIIMITIRYRMFIKI